MDSELLYVFGTGNATVTNLYNTCFAHHATGTNILWWMPAAETGS